MVKHTQTIRWQFADELFVFSHFAGLVFKGLNQVLFSESFKIPTLGSNVIPLLLFIEHQPFPTSHPYTLYSLFWNMGRLVWGLRIQTETRGTHITKYQKKELKVEENCHAWHLSHMTIKTKTIAMESYIQVSNSNTC